MNQHLSDIHLQVLVFMSLLGEATEDEVGHVSDLPAEDCEAEMLDLANDGLAKWGGGSSGWSITDLGRAEHARRAPAEVNALGLRDLVAETHAEVVEAGDDHARVVAAVEALVARMRRFGAYPRRLAAAEAAEGAQENVSSESWAEVRDMLVRDLEITLGL